MRPSAEGDDSMTQPQPWKRPRWFIPLIVGAVVLFVSMQIIVGILSFRHTWPQIGLFSPHFTVAHAPLSVGSSGVMKDREYKDVRLTLVSITG